MNRNIKTFIYVSVFIHLSGGAALYMYYFNPSAPQPLMEDRVEEPKANLENQKIAVNQTPVVKRVSIEKSKPVKRKTLSVKTASTKKKPTASRPPIKKKDLSLQGTGSKAENSKDFVNPTGREKRAEKQPHKKTPSIHSKTHFPDQKNKRKKAGSLPVSTKAEKSSASHKTNTRVSGEEKGEQQNSSPDLQTKTLIGKTFQSPEIPEKTETRNAMSTPLADTKDNKGDSAAEENSPEPLTEKNLRENKDPKTSETLSASPQTKSPKAKKKPEAPDSSNVSKPSPSSPKFRKFIDVKQKLGNPRLDYPPEAREQKMQGRVSLIYFIDPAGLVDQIQLEKSSGHSLLDNFVLRTIARYEFLPQQEGWVKHTVNFVLKGEEEQIFKLRDKNQ